MGYREKYFSKNDAYDNNNGWYRCVKCGRKAGNRAVAKLYGDFQPFIVGL